MKNKREKKRFIVSRQSRGITLIALVITIIVLLILAGVSLSMVLNQDGIFSRAEQATDKYGQAKARETLELALGEAQMQKYEQGLTDEQLDEQIKKVGSFIPKEDPNSNNQLVIVDGHIFEIDRSVPKIVDYKGPANGIIITASITQNGNWTNPTATVKGTITKYGGGTVTSSSATATNGVTISGFPTTGGSYTISNITEDTDITITAQDSEGHDPVTETIRVRLVRDTTPPVLSNIKVETNRMKIKISANATDTESGVAQINYKIIPNTVDTKTQTEGTLQSGEEKEIITTTEGEYTVTFTATDNAGNTSAPSTAKAKTSKLMSVEEAKRLVTSMEALQEYIGEKINYKSGETWQIFYYDEAGEFGPEKTLYLKKAWESHDRVLTLSTKTSETDPAVAIMRRMNPQWRDSSYSKIDINNEKACVWLCDPEVWNSQRNETYSSFAIGSPSIEMYMKAYNVWKTGDKDANNIICKIENANGYTVGVNGVYKEETYSVDYGPNGIFCGGISTRGTICSPYHTSNCTVCILNSEGSDQRQKLSGYQLDYGTFRAFSSVVPLDL